MKKPDQIDPRWRWHHRRLLELRKHLTEIRSEHRAVAIATAEPEGVVSAEHAGDRMERETLLTELAAEENELGAIDAALQRMRDGTYGICLRTGQPISAARLRALPWTPYSRAAAAQLEAGGQAFRPSSLGKGQ